MLLVFVVFFVVLWCFVLFALVLRLVCQMLPVSCVSNVTSVLCVKCYQCLVCQMLPVSCVSDVTSVLCVKCYQCLCNVHFRPVSCVSDVTSVLCVKCYQCLCNVHFRPVSCVSDVTSVSVMSICVLCLVCQMLPVSL